MGFNGRRCKTPLCPYLHSTLYKNYVSHIFSYSDLSPVPVRSAVKVYLTSWFIQNLSNRALNKLTLVSSTTCFGRLFQILTVCALVQKSSAFVVHNEICETVIGKFIFISPGYRAQMICQFK